MDDNQEKTFTQAEVDHIVGERLSRVKTPTQTTPTDYDDLKEIATILEDFDYAGMTIAEKKVAFKAQADQYKAQKELAELQEQDTVTTADQKRINKLEKELLEIRGELQAPKKAEEQKKQIEDSAKKEIAEFNEKFTDIDTDKVLNDAKFMKFANKKAGTLTELYEDYIEFIGETESEMIVKSMSKESRTTSSGKATNNDGGNYNLTENQKQLAKKSGMTFKEYEEILKNII